ncbi:hypothetical protein ACFWZ2_23500 [Streptomyces sp. NPDC059002]|uniref:hypothetical protein n=1 Tax=Streptomyces sp. NPDC059002 TaxID=3346690 RepID=UPI0036B425C3
MSEATETVQAPETPETAVPRDYQLLVPREWFRIDLTQDRWRSQLKTFVDRQAEGRAVSADLTRKVWVSLRNTAETGRARGAMEFYLLATSRDGRMPASLLVSMVPLGRTPADPHEYAAWLELREPGEGGPRREISVVDLPAGPAVRVLGPASLDIHVHMPRGTGYLTLSFAAPLTGMAGPMERLCDAMAGSLRWVE